MARPKIVRIGHMTFSVSTNTEELDAHGADGIFHEPTRRIVIRDGLVLDKQREVLLHEVLHGVIEAANLAWDDADDEERIVRSMTGPLLDTFRSNPQLVTFLLSSE